MHLNSQKSNLLFSKLLFPNPDVTYQQKNKTSNPLTLKNISSDWLWASFVYIVLFLKPFPPYLLFTSFSSNYFFFSFSTDPDHRSIHQQFNSQFCIYFISSFSFHNLREFNSFKILDRGSL